MPRQAKATTRAKGRAGRPPTPRLEREALVRRFGEAFERDMARQQARGERAGVYAAIDRVVRGPFRCSRRQGYKLLEEYRSWKARQSFEATLEGLSEPVIMARRLAFLETVTNPGGLRPIERLTSPAREKISPIEKQLQLARGAQPPLVWRGAGKPGRPQ